MNLERLREDAVHAEPDGGAHEQMLHAHLKALVDAIPVRKLHEIGIVDEWTEAVSALSAYRLGQIRYEEATK